MSLIVSSKINLGFNSAINLDKSIYLYVNNTHFKPINQFMIYLTLYGRDLFWVLVIVFLFIFGGIIGKKTAFILALIIIALIPIGIIAKEVIERPRPMIPTNDFLIPADSEFSFPSGHALIVSAGAVTVLSLFRDSKTKFTISLILILEAALVCISRVYTGGHYPLDVIGGIILGVGVSCLFIWKEKKLYLMYQQIMSRLKRETK
jgi:membrane-associated phospholipid phosphatase